MYNSTYAPRDDPLSVTNESLIIILLSDETRPQIGEPYYWAELVEETPVDTRVPRLDILVINNNKVC